MGTADWYVLCCGHEKERERMYTTSQSNNIYLHFTIKYVPLINCMSLLWLKLFRSVRIIETLF
jgi:hypothetical protein